ncbi:MAG TPA: Mov34/MPN/PAD-1 family protein [Kofleriaceae bacterium]|nr:Mov34/MPN/PAD-1 family protein [Kofleriaceae bacterium]
MSSLDIRAIDESDLKKEKAPAVKMEYRVFLSEEAFDRAVERGTKDTSREIGGVLVGNVYKDDQGPYLKIETTIDALHADEKGAELTFTHDTWDHINKEMDGKYKDKKVVGWYHTHPGFSVFLSDRDQFIQKSFFNLPFQVAFVYDPKSKEHGMFTWHDNEIRRSRRYWIGAKEQTWDGNRASGAPEKKDVERKDDESKSSGGGSSEPLLGEGPGAFAAIVIIGLILLLLGGFIGRWWGMKNTVEIAQQAQIEIVKAKAEGQASTLASLQGELVGVLRSVMGDEALHKPVEDAVTSLDALLKDLDAPAQPGTDQAKKLKETVITLRNQLATLANDRSSAQATLEILEMASKSTSLIRADLAREVAQQRAAVGLLYSELAADIAKNGDKARATRLLQTAARLDPGNTSQYQMQLKSIDSSATLPRANDVAPQPEAPKGPTPPAAGAGSGATASAGSGGVQ